MDIYTYKYIIKKYIYIFAYIYIHICRHRITFSPPPQLPLNLLCWICKSFFWLYQILKQIPTWIETEILIFFLGIS